MILLPGELPEQFQNFIPHNGIKSGGGFIEHKQFCVMAQGCRKGKFHPHAAGIGFEWFFLRQIKAFEKFRILCAVPVLIRFPENSAYL